MKIRGCSDLDEEGGVELPDGDIVVHLAGVGVRLGHGAALVQHSDVCLPEDLQDLGGSNGRRFHKWDW